MSGVKKTLKYMFNEWNLNKDDLTKDNKFNKDYAEYMKNNIARALVSRWGHANVEEFVNRR